MDRTSEIALAETLSELGTLDGLDHPRLEAIAELVRVLDHQNDETIQECYCSTRWWGGAGSMFDYIPEKNHRRYLELLLAHLKRPDLTAQALQAERPLFKSGLIRR